MKERPILFSAPMVRAILEGRKTVTRRIVKNLPARVESISYVPNFDQQGFFTVVSETQPRYALPCPYGQPSDQLWVRETWMENHSGPEINGRGQPLYRASWGNTPEGQRWKPSIHMPRWASRLSLEITGVKVERLQDITEEQAIAEGIDWDNWEDTDALNLTTCGTSYRNYALESDADYPFDSARDSFRSLWESINGPETWDLNPWVWCVSFRRVKP